jgi:hypothetical protein
MKTIKFLFLLTILLIANRLFSQEKGDIPVDIISTVVTEDTCIIFYNLEGSQDIQYKITLFLRQNKEKPVRIQLKNVSGDIGVGHYTGKGNKIIWNVKKEALKDIDANFDVQFEIMAEVISTKIEKVEVSEGSNLLYWIGGGALVVGGIAYLIIKPPPPPPTYLPDPVGLGNPK